MADGKTKARSWFHGHRRRAFSLLAFFISVAPARAAPNQSKPDRNFRTPDLRRRFSSFSGCPKTNLRPLAVNGQMVKMPPAYRPEPNRRLGCLAGAGPEHGLAVGGIGLE